MNPETAPRKVRSIEYRRILNSHVGFTTEFVVTLDDGTVGIGASPQGETVSVYEDQGTGPGPQSVVRGIKQDDLIEEPLSQASLDEYLRKNFDNFGRNNCWALSLAFFNAANSPLSQFWAPIGTLDAPRPLPRLCLNVLNGGRHAYTNPVLSDFPEFLVVPRHDDLFRTVHDHAEIQQKVREGLRNSEQVVVNGNRVARFRTTDNRECLDFLSRVMQSTGVAEDYDLMIDASAGDLYKDGKYSFSVTDGSLRTTDELRSYWLEMIKDYMLGFLEDPFMEKDFAGWSTLVDVQTACRIIGDNLYSSDAARIKEGSEHCRSHGVIVKPNQAGSVTAVREALETCRQTGQIAITSHRSISTESPFLSILTVNHAAPYMKIGPLLTDYSSVVRLNELIRLSGLPHE